MKIFKSIAAACCLALICLVYTPAARADLWNQASKLHFNHPIEVPGVVLPAGTYWFVLENDSSNRNVVEIFNAQRSTLYTTELTIPALRQYAHGKTEVVFAERRTQPDALLKWYYPGLRTGHQFLYPQHEEKHLRRDEKEVVFALPPSSPQANAIG